MLKQKKIKPLPLLYITVLVTVTDSVFIFGNLKEKGDLNGNAS